MAIKLDKAEIEFIERMGLLAQGDGLSRITGRLWGLFMLVDGVLSFSEIAETLKISRGSVSTNARVLQHLNVLERRSLPGERQDFFAVKKDPYLSLLESGYHRQLEKVKMVRDAMEEIKRPAAATHLDELATFYSAMANGFNHSLSELQSEDKEPKK